MSKLLSATLITTAFLVVGFSQNTDLTIAGTCASRCGVKPIQFTPGKHLRLEVINSTPNLIYVEKAQTTKPILLRPGQRLRLEQGDGTKQNISVMFWNENGLSLKANLSQLNFATLQVRLRPEWRIGGDRGVYIRDDGRVTVL